MFENLFEYQSCIYKEAYSLDFQRTVHLRYFFEPLFLNYSQILSAACCFCCDHIYQFPLYFSKFEPKIEPTRFQQQQHQNQKSRGRNQQN